MRSSLVSTSPNWNPKLHHSTPVHLDGQLCELMSGPFPDSDASFNQVTTTEAAGQWTAGGPQQEGKLVEMCIRYYRIASQKMGINHLQNYINTHIEATLLQVGGTFERHPFLHEQKSSLQWQAWFPHAATPTAAVRRPLSGMT